MRKWLALLLGVQIVAVKLLGIFPEFVEKWYSHGLYPAWSEFERTVLGWLPFSFGDVVYMIAIIWLLSRLWKTRRHFFKQWKNHLLTGLAVLSIVYFMFHFSWGMNYYRVKLADRLGLQVNEPEHDSASTYTNAQLYRLTEFLIAKTDSLQEAITGNQDQPVAPPYSHEEIFGGNIDGYQTLSKTYPFLEYRQPSVKNSLFSLPLTYMGFAGYLNPFTGEAQVNDMIPMYNYPTVAAHEMAHQMGYASESEANFIGYLATIRNPNRYFRYSGYVTALRYCLGNWEVRDEHRLKEFLAAINPGVRANFRQSEAFWDSHETFIETGFKIFYDNFLKMNKQEGLESYNRFVDLMIAYYANGF